MDIRKLTQLIVVIFIVAIFGYDLFAYIKGGQEATVSFLIIDDWSRNFPAFTFFVGFIMGHLFWPLSEKKGLKDDISRD